MATIDDAALRDTAVSAVGTTQATATPIKVKHAMTSEVTAGAGVVLVEYNCAKMSQGTIHNGSAAAGAVSTGAALLIYPWSGAAFNGQAVDSPLSLPAGMGCHWVYLNSAKIGIIYS